MLCRLPKLNISMVYLSVGQAYGIIMGFLPFAHIQIILYVQMIEK